MTKSILNVHVFTDAPAALFIKQFPGFVPELDGFRFTFGLDIAKGIDLLILFNRASFSVPTDLPVERTAFIAAEPEAIHPYSRRFLNQFGIALTATEKSLTTQQWRTAPCWYWFAGYDFAKGLAFEDLKGHDYFSTLAVPEKRNTVAVVTSNKSKTPYHQQRVALLDALIEKIPQHLEVYGRGYRQIDDKAHALLPCKYHLALENSGGPDTWTEKFADPMLCWTFPFYNGCTNLDAYFPNGSFAEIDVSDADRVAARIVQAIENDQWSKALPAIKQARETVLAKQNIARQLVDLCHKLMAQTTRPTKRKYIWSERSLWPEPGCRGSVGEWAFRNAVMAFDPMAEMKTIELRRKIEAKRTRKRQAKLAELEQGKNGK